MAVILDGRLVASVVMEELKEQVKTVRTRGVTPTLALVFVGEDRYSRQYVEMKARRCREVGVEARVYDLPSLSAEKDVISLIQRLNEDSSVHGVLVQLPLPMGMDELRVVEAISPVKDVDCLSPVSLGKVLMGGEAFLPAGVEAILELLRRHSISFEGKHWVAVGLSNIVGKPLAAYLMNQNVKLTCCKGNEADLAEQTRRADVLVVDMARKWAVTADMVKKGCVVFDNGNNYEGKKVYGDVDFEAVRDVASAITPVPGGIGPVLVTMLIRNTVGAASKPSS